MVQQTSIMHAQISASSANNFGGRDSSVIIGAERAPRNHSVASQLVGNASLTNHHHHQHLGIVASNLQHHHPNSINMNRIHKNGAGTNVGNNSNFPNNHHHHLGHNNRGRIAGAPLPAPSIAAAAAAMALNSHLSQHVHTFTASSKNDSALTSNPHVHQHHHHHPLSLASSNSSSSASSAASSPPSASISPSSLAPGTPPQTGNILGTNPISSYLSSSSSNHHYQSNTNQHNQTATNYSHVLSSQNINNQQPQQQQQQQQNTSRYKTELCRPFEENGTCKYGEKCQFAHGMGELRTLTRHPKYKTEFCRTFHTTGFCPYGPRCHFIHNSKTPPTNQQSLSLGSYNNGLPFGHQSSHSASPSTSPISSTSSATTTNGSSSLSSSASTASSSSTSSNSQRMLDSMTGFQYSGRLATNGLFSGAVNSSSQLSNELDRAKPTTPAKSLATIAVSANHHRRNENDEASTKGKATGCAKETQRLLWIHSQMNESSRWPPAMCASGLISNNTNSRRTWQMQA